ncbi:MAG: hypothetical protein Q7U89_05240, partial [Coriobacteriia bacterium]|nr:hypothetical protein [Coriobacteriia bacterium]
MSARQAMTSHLQEVWPGLVSALASETAESPRIPEAVASGSVPGTPTMVWGYAADFPEGADVWEGVYPAAPANSSIPGDPAAERVIEIIKKYDPKIAGKEYLGLFGAVSMMHVVEGLKNAGRDLTQESMIKG